MKSLTLSGLVVCATLAYAAPSVAEDAVAPAEVAAPAEKAEPAPAVVDAAPAQASAPEAIAADQEAAKVTDAADAEEKIICKRVEATGTRLRKGKVCKPESFWRKVEKGAEDAVAGIERGNSTGVGGATLPPGG